MGTTGTGLPSPKSYAAATTVTVVALPNESVVVYDARVIGTQSGNLVLSDSTGTYATVATSGTLSILDLTNDFIIFPAGEDVTLAATTGNIRLTAGIKIA